jgi:hypothetical protein
MKIKSVSSLFLSIMALFTCSNQIVKEEIVAFPNIILIYLDDMEYGDLSLTGATEYKTPNLIEDNLLEVLFPVNSYH